MSIQRLFPHPRSHQYFPYILLVAICFLACLFMIQPPSVFDTSAGQAFAGLPTPKDKDDDLLPDAFEEILGTNYMRVDSDEDGIPDGVEYVMRSDPLDPDILPTIEPGMRMALYQEGSLLKIAFYFFPGDVVYLNKFNFLIAYADSMPGDNSSIPPQQLNATELIPYVLSSTASTYYNGVKLTCYEIYFPKTTLKRYSPLSFGAAANYNFDLQSPFTDVADIDFIDDIPVQVSTLGAGINDDLDKFFSALTDDTPVDWTSNEICKTTLEEVSSNEGVVTYEVKSASCQAMPDQTCSGSGCGGQVGGTVITIDPNFLTSTLEE